MFYPGSPTSRMAGAPSHPAYWLRWGLTDFLPTLALNLSPPNLHLSTSLGHEPLYLAIGSFGGFFVAVLSTICLASFVRIIQNKTTSKRETQV
jgi:hypothetical protein